mmetsp:Transcript_50200/g.102336  ORF Transcript_50200/g.102336 Transcript_50200/m.102336 type:complete len:102 (-) Transcript_50200:3-308(-)
MAHHESFVLQDAGSFDSEMDMVLQGVLHGGGQRGRETSHVPSFSFMSPRHVQHSLASRRYGTRNAATAQIQNHWERIHCGTASEFGIRSFAECCNSHELLK